jgi:hypothetical protein
MMRKALLVCGIVASLLYVGMNVFVPLGWPAYSSATYTVSELSAIDAPTRSLWVPLAIVYTLLMAAFGYGVWASAHRNRPLRIAGLLLMFYGLLGLAWPPMHLREVIAAGGATLTDTMHIAFAMVTVVLMLSAMSCGAVALGRTFKYYSLATIATLLLFGLLTTLEAPMLDQNLPTPWIGVWERINIGVFLVWVIALAVVLLQEREELTRIIRLKPDPTSGPINPAKAGSHIRQSG